MMSYEEWLNCILNAAQDISSRAFQEEAWKAEGNVASSPDEVYQVLMEDCTPDLFFETYGKTVTDGQVQCWNELRSRLERYYDKMPRYSDPAQVLNDPEWERVRQAAARFVQAFNQRSGERAE